MRYWLVTMQGLRVSAHWVCVKQAKNRDLSHGKEVSLAAVPLIYVIKVDFFQRERNKLKYFFFLVFPPKKRNKDINKSIMKQTHKKSTDVGINYQPNNCDISIHGLETCNQYIQVCTNYLLCFRFSAPVLHPCITALKFSFSPYKSGVSVF